MGRVEILNGAERRRRWSEADKRRIVEESFAPGVQVVDVARRNGASTSLVFAWRRQAREAAPKSAPTFLPVGIGDAATAAGIEAERAPRAGRRSGLIEIELRDGKRLRVDSHVDADALGRVLDALARR